MIKLAPKFFKCQHTKEPAEFIVLQRDEKNDPLSYFISAACKKQYSSNLFHLPMSKIPVRVRNEKVVEELSKLEHSIFKLVHEPRGKDSSLRQRFAQEAINLFMPVCASVAVSYGFANDGSRENVKSELNKLLNAAAHSRLILKKRKFKMMYQLQEFELEQIRVYFLDLLRQLYEDVVEVIGKKRIPPSNRLSPEKVKKEPFIEENKAFEPARKEAPFLSEVKIQKSSVQLRYPYAVTPIVSSSNAEKEQGNYDLPKAYPDLGFNHLRESSASIKKKDEVLDLDFTKNTENVSNTTLYNLSKKFDKFKNLKTVSLTLDGCESIGPAGFEYLKNGLLKLDLESIFIRASGCSRVDDKCTEALIHGIMNGKKLTEVYVDFSGCPGISNRSLALFILLSEKVKSLKKLTINFASLTDEGLMLLRKVFSNGKKLSHIGLNFKDCENVTKVGIQDARFYIRNYPNIVFYELFENAN